MSRRPPRRVGSYRKAIEWIAAEDDTDWLDDQDDDLKTSVTASLVMDVFDCTEEEVVRDLRNAIKRLGIAKS